METIRDQVYRVLTERANEPLNVSEISEITGLNSKRVSGALWGLKGDNMGVIHRGRATYVYDSSTNTSSFVDSKNEDEIVDLFERVGWFDTEPPTPILRANDGSYWKAVPL